MAFLMYLAPLWDQLDPFSVLTVSRPPCVVSPSCQMVFLSGSSAPRMSVLGGRKQKLLKAWDWNLLVCSIDLIHHRAHPDARGSRRFTHPSGRNVKEFPAI